MSQQRPEGYLALPSTGRVILSVLHAWWGVNETESRGSASAGGRRFRPLALDLYHGKIARTTPEARPGRRAGCQLPAGPGRNREAAAFLSRCAGSSGRGLAVVAFSLGAYYAVDLSANAPDQVDSVVLFYGYGDSDLSNARAAYPGHFAELDEYEPAEDVAAFEEAVKRAGRPVTFIVTAVRSTGLRAGRPEYNPKLRIGVGSARSSFFESEIDEARCQWQCYVHHHDHERGRHGQPRHSRARRRGRRAWPEEAAPWSSR